MEATPRMRKGRFAIAAFLVCLLICLPTPAHARNAFDIVSIDLSVSPNPIPCGGTATATATIQMPKDKKNPDAIETAISLWDYDTWFRDGDDELDRKSGLFWIEDDKIVVEFTLHCQIKEADCDLYGPSGESGESGTYVYVRVGEGDTKSPRVYVQCKQTEVDAIVRLDGPDGPGSPDEPTHLEDDNTILPGGRKIVTMSAETPIEDVVSGSWKIEYDPSNLLPTRVDYIHPAFSTSLQHEIFSDHIAFEFNAPPPGRSLDGELVKIHFQALETPAAEWAPTYVRCADDSLFTDSTGEPIRVCTGGALSLFVPPVDEEAPILNPAHIHFGLREITGTAGAVSDNRSDLENYLTVALHDENHERVAACFAAADGSFHLDNFFMLDPERASTLVVYDGVENRYAYSFIPAPDVQDAVLLLQMLSGQSLYIPLPADVSGDGQTGLDEVVYVLQRVSGQRAAPPLTLSVLGTVPSGTGGRVEPAIQMVAYGAEASFTVIPETGYEASPVVGGTCAGGTQDGSSYTTGPLTANCEVTFSFIPLTYMVTAEAGPGGLIDPSSQAVDHGQTVAFALSPDMGYGVAGVTGCGGTLDGFTYTTASITGDCTVTATFGVNPYTLSFDSAGGTPVDAITRDYGTAVTEPEAPTREGYTFAGWAPEVPSTMPAGDLTVTAQWTINQYTLTFDSDGGSPVDAITRDYGTAVTAPAAPTREGYTFAGWNPEVPATMPAENLTLVASWTINQYTISFDSNGGSPVAPITRDYGTAVTAPADPTREGFTFTGWSPGVPATMPAENLALTAQWAINHYTVTASAGSGGEVDPAVRMVDHGTTASFTVTPEMDYEPDLLVSGACPMGTWDGYTYTTGPVTGDCSVAFTFTLIPFPDSITTLSPNVDQENMASGVSEDTNIQVEFNETISDSLYVFSTGEAGPFFTIVESESGNPVEGHVTVQGSLLTFTPAEQLKENMTYWLSVSENVFSIGSPVPDPEMYHWSVTTQDVLQDVYRVWHPIEGSIPGKYYDVGYEIDGSRNLSLDQVNDMIANAESSADLYNNLEPTASPPPLSTEKFTKFHFWPNIINLSAIYNNTAYPDLFDLILDDAWNYTNTPTLLKAQITSDIMDGDRIFLARDFIDKIIYNFQSFQEVHYVMIINLDKKTVTEILGHPFSEAGLPVLHDPHIDLLQAAFDGTDDSPGEIWDMCLRGNRTKKYQAINVDRLLTESGSMAYFISRIDLNCLCASCPPFDSGFWDFEPGVPWEPWIPPVIRIPEIIDPPPGGNGGGVISGDPPAAGNPLDNPENQPVEPWTFPATPIDEDTIDPDSDVDGDEGTGDACEGLEAGCDGEDYETASRLKQEIDDQLQNARDSRASDVTTFSGDKETTWGFEYEWVSDAAFNDPCIQELYNGYNSQIAGLKAGIEDLVAEYNDLYDQRKALRDNANNVFQALMYRENLWSNMLEVNGDWHDVEPEPCMPPWIPAGGNPFEDPSGGGVVIVGAKLQAKFQRAVAYAMMNGKTFDQAVEEAINSKDCYPNNDPDDPDTQPRATVYKDTVFVMIWKRYAECLNRLYAKIARNYMNMAFGDGEALSEDDVNRKVAALLMGSSSLSPEERSAYEALKSQIDAINERLRELSEEIDAKRNEIDRLRREFRQKVLDCLKVSLENIRELRVKSWILEAFLIWCENPEAEEAVPKYVDLERFCRMLQELLDHPDTVASPKLTAYLEMLRNCNC
jgi:uncharacterized repeat protein (TIGR02543 family)